MPSQSTSLFEGINRRLQSSDIADRAVAERESLVGLEQFDCPVEVLLCRMNQFEPCRVRESKTEVHGNVVAVA